MNFTELDTQMRKYEQSLDQYTWPAYLVVRLDGRSFSKFTNERFDKPFDINFRNLMIDVVKHLMTKSGFRIIYGYTESDEISLLFHPEDNTFEHKVRKINTTLAGEASAVFSLLVGEVVSFDCRIIPLPTLEKVLDYFSWRQEDSHRNSLNGYCYWTLVQNGYSKRKATSELNNKNNAYKHDLLFKYGINYNYLPAWQKRGIGLYFKNIQKEGFNPKTNETVLTTRRELFLDEEIPYNEEYKNFIKQIIEENSI